MYAEKFQKVKHRKSFVPQETKQYPRQRIKNMFISRWKKKRLDYRIKLPLNRLAFLKARYDIGPFKPYKCSSEIPINFFKSLATLKQSNNVEGYLVELECHPICLVTDYSEHYLQYKAYLYGKQNVGKVDSKYQTTAVETAVSFESGSLLWSPQTINISFEISDDKFMKLNSIATGFEETEEDLKKREEFQKVIRESKKKLDEVKNVFYVLKQQKEEESKIYQRSESEDENKNDGNRYKKWRESLKKYLLLSCEN